MVSCKFRLPTSLRGLAVRTRKKEKNSEPKPSLLALPAEVRNEIYEMALVSQTPIKPWLSKNAQAPKLSGQLLRACKQIRREATAMLYGANTFTFRLDHINDYSSLWTWTSRLSASTFGLLRRVRFTSEHLLSMPCTYRSRLRAAALARAGASSGRKYRHSWTEFPTVDHFDAILDVELDLVERRVVHVARYNVEIYMACHDQDCLERSFAITRIDFDGIWGSDRRESRLQPFQRFSRLVVRLCPEYAMMGTMVP